MLSTTYSTSNLKTILLVAAGIAVSILLLNTMLTLVTAAYPNWLPRQFFGVDFIVDNRQRALAAARQYRTGEAGEEHGFILILGLSSASEGISLQDLTRGMTDGTRFLALSGGGRNMADAARYARPLLNSEATPKLAVLAINPFHVMDPPLPYAAFWDNLSRQETLDDLRGYWLVNRRQDFKYVVDASIDQIRSGVFGALDARYENEANPWRESTRMGLPQATLVAQWEANVRTYGERGYYDGANYGRSVTQPAILDDLISSFLTRGSEVVVILMPEHSRLRALIPDAATQLMVASVAGASQGVHSARIVDFRSAIPDAGFKDISHMNEAGRSQFSPMLRDLITERLASDLSE